MTYQLPNRPNIDHLKKQAKDLLVEQRQCDPKAIQRIMAHHPSRSNIDQKSISLSDTQAVIAREYGFESWPKMKSFIESKSGMGISETLTKAIQDLKAGKCCVLFDDEGRENEGDIVYAAEKVSPEAINFITKYARGTLCLAMTEEYTNRLNLNPVNPNATEISEPAFLNSIDATKGITTGVSAFDRSHTIKEAIREGARAMDVKSPGHIFPLKAHPGGLKKRVGHTEGSVELARLAGLKPAAVICEILKEDGTMARWPDLMEFAVKHELQLIRISELM